MKWIFYNFGHSAYSPLQREVLRLNFHLVWGNSRIKRSIKICLFLYNVYNVELKIQGVYRGLPRFKSWSADLLSWCRIFVVCLYLQLHAVMVVLCMPLEMQQFGIVYGPAGWSLESAWPTEGSHICCHCRQSIHDLSDVHPVALKVSLNEPEINEHMSCHGGEPTDRNIPFLLHTVTDSRRFAGRTVEIWCPTRLPLRKAGRSFFRLEQGDWSVNLATHDVHSVQMELCTWEHGVGAAVMFVTLLKKVRVSVANKLVCRGTCSKPPEPEGWSPC